MNRIFKSTSRSCGGLMLAVFAVAFVGEASAYCTSQGNSTNYEWIERVSVANYSNTSGSDGGYGDFTSQVISLSAGSNDLSLSPGFRSSSYTESWKIWIDFNFDNSYSEDEVVFSGASRSIMNGAISIPGSATGGYTGMRVSMRYSSAPSSCGSFSYGEVEDYFVYIDTIDTSSPTVSSTSPANTAVDVALGTVVNVTFSEDIDPLSVHASSLVLTQGGLFITGTIETSGSTLSFTPDQPLDYSSTYTATVFAGLLDLSANPLAQDYSWSFTTTTPDLTAPTIIDVSPNNGATDVDNNMVIWALFSEAMDATTINESSFTLSDGINNVAGSVVLLGNDNNAQFYPDQPLNYLTTYTATVSASAGDLAGNILQEDYSWSFTAREYQLDYCSSYANNSTYMWISAVKVRNFTASSPSQPYSGYSDNTATIFDLSRSFSNSVTLTPGYNSYAYTTAWNVFIDWNQDGVFSPGETAVSGSGNSPVAGAITIPDDALAGNTRMRVSMQYVNAPGACGSLSYGEVEDFRVNIPEAAADYTPPSVISVSPSNGAQAVPVGTAIAVQFDEEIDIATLSSNSLLLSGSTPVEFNVTYDTANWVAVFTPVSNLDHDLQYSSTLLSGISDTSGNVMASDYLWTFTTESEIAASYSVSGTVQHQGVGLEGVDISVTGDAVLSTMTDASGDYSLNLSPGNYTITPTRGGYSIAPENVGLIIDDADISNVDFTATQLPSPLANGNFDIASFSGWNSFTTGDGGVSKNIVSTDVDNDGQSSLAAQFSVGVITATGSQQGGGIYQTVALSAGDLSVSMDISAAASGNNGSGGLVQILFDGAVMASHDFGSITSSASEYEQLSFYLPNVSAGNHEFRIRITRPYLQTSVYNYLDDIVLTGSSTQ